MSRPNLILIKTINTPRDELTEEFENYKNSLPDDHQLSFFDIIVHNEADTWFAEALKKLNEEE